jgi:hypothetical protein
MPNKCESWWYSKNEEDNSVIVKHSSYEYDEEGRYIQDSKKIISEYEISQAAYNKYKKAHGDDIYDTKSYHMEDEALDLIRKEVEEKEKASITEDETKIIIAVVLFGVFLIIREILRRSE